MAGTLKDLTTVQELEDALAESNERAVLLFKHSTACPISSRALAQLQDYLEDADQRASYHLITVQTSRSVSNEAASRLRVPHESPQAILIRSGRPVWDASHFEITASSLAEAISRVGTTPEVGVP
jgi:bacillithiol system protein YtxJ